MPTIVSDIVDVYVFRRLNARVQFLLLQRRADVSLPRTWQACHTQVRAGDSTAQTIYRAVAEHTGLHVKTIYAADFINQFYDENRDAVVLAPVFAVMVDSQSPLDIGDDFRDVAWLDLNEATARLAFSGQRWAVRHIDEIMSLGEQEASIYRLEMADQRPQPTPIVQDDVPLTDDDQAPTFVIDGEGEAGPTDDDDV